jgi:NodT family efflux transporter outer membrane factor (OMF) lipoprotein
MVGKQFFHNNLLWNGLGLAALSALIWGGCTVGPDYQPPEKPESDAWHQAILEDFAQETPQLQQWWTNFNDPKLTELTDRAVQGNLNLKQAVARIEQARAFRGVSKGEWFPDVDGKGNAARTRASEETVPLTPPGVGRTDNFFDIGLDSSWEIDVWGRIRRSVESADAALQASFEDYRDVLVVLCAEVGVNYFEYRSLQERIALASQSTKNQRQTLGLTQNRNKAGLVPDLDISQAQLNLSRTESFIPQLEQQLAVTQHRLAVLLGQSPSALVEELKSVTPLPSAPLDVMVGIPADLMRQRPDVRRAERLLAAQTARIGVAKAELWPRFSLLGSFAFEATDIENVLEGGSRAYGFGPSVRWNLFDGGRIRNLVKIEESLTDQALLAYEQTLLFAMEDVENSMVL